ncbi:hypothetical protein BOX15_Mlig020199g1 [Macrostomum lignano]|uniref:Amiloride-sensitive sodium channel n=1 Tax=Macrostomum lignano TaxID=282301 RepID=A0A267FFW2_9PLAT|nr:hypothetical protein BOX15_Mlig020199g1 [Macrostomum lignano]
MKLGSDPPMSIRPHRKSTMNPLTESFGLRCDGGDCTSSFVDSTTNDCERKLRHHHRQRMLYTNLHGFAGRTSAHGLGRFFAQQVPWLRLLWGCVVLGAVTGLTLHTYKQISLFRAYPVSSTTRLLTNQFTFPDVTFCDPLMKKFLTLNSDSLRTESREISDYFTASYMLGYGFASTPDSSGPHPKQEESAGRVKAIKIAYASFEHAVHSWPKFNMSAASARIYDMLIYCQYNQERCSEANFTVFYHRGYGNCFSFKADSRSIKSSGVEKGLVLILYSPSVDVKQSIDYYSEIVTTGLETGGLRVAVHQKDTIPYPGEYGINSPSGMQTVLALSQVQTNLADTPTKRCEARTNFQAFDHLLDTVQVYDRQLADCTTFEHLKSVQEKCGCTIEGLVKTHSGRRPDEDYCHDLLGAQDTKQLPKLLSEINQFFQRDLLVSNMSLIEKSGRLSLRTFSRLAYTDRLRVAELLSSKFPVIGRRLNRLKCALPHLRTGRKPSSCLNICNYTTYDFSVFQSRWPDPNFQIRGARIRLARIAAMLKSRIKEIDTNLLRLRAVNPAFDTNHALNHSIAYHGVNLSECLDDRLNKSLDRFDSDEHCQQVHSIIRQSFLQLRVYPKTLTVRQLYEERSYELVNLFSDLGGIMGLWIGVSVVTLCEFGEISLIVASYYVRLLIRRLALALGTRALLWAEEKPELNQKSQQNRLSKRQRERQKPQKADNQPFRQQRLGSSGRQKLFSNRDPNRYWQPRLRHGLDRSLNSVKAEVDNEEVSKRFSIIRLAL